MNRRHVALWAAGLALFVAAGVVRAITPDDDVAPLEPFVVTAPVGATATGRNLVVTVTDVRRASRVSDEEASAAGNWLVVELDAATVVADDQSIGLATFAIDGRTYSTSDRLSSTIDQAQLTIDLPQHGMVAFELPADVRSGTGVLSFAIDGDPRLDSLLQVPVTLDDLDTAAAVEIEPPEWADP